MMRMIWKETRRKDKKRSTPKDVENEKKGIYRGSKPRKRARKPTVEENRANKMASVMTSAELISIRPWSLFISDELRQMNRGKEGRPFEYPDSMFVWIMLFMGYLDLTYGKAAVLAKETLEDHGMGSPSLSTVFRRITRIVRSLVISALRRIPAYCACMRTRGRSTDTIRCLWTPADSTSSRVSTGVPRNGVPWMGTPG